MNNAITFEKCDKDHYYVNRGDEWAGELHGERPMMFSMHSGYIVDRSAKRNFAFIPSDFKADPIPLKATDVRSAKREVIALLAH